MYGRPIPITPVRRRTRSWLERVVDFLARDPRARESTPGVDGARRFNSRRCSARATDDAAAVARYRLLAVEQAERLTRGTAIARAARRSARARSLSAARGRGDRRADRARAPAHARCARRRATRGARAAPRLESLTRPERDVERLLRDVLSRRRRPMPTASPTTPAASLAWAKEMAAKIRRERGRYRGLPPTRSGARCRQPVESDETPTDARRRSTPPPSEVATVGEQRRRMRKASTRTTATSASRTGNPTRRRTNRSRPTSPATAPSRRPIDGEAQERRVAASCSIDDAPHDGVRGQGRDAHDRQLRRRSRSRDGSPAFRTTSGTPTRVAIVGAPRSCVSHEPVEGDERWSTDVAAASTPRSCARFGIASSGCARDACCSDGSAPATSSTSRRASTRSSTGASGARPTIVSISTRARRAAGSRSRCWSTSAARPSTRVTDELRIIDLERIALLLASEALDALGDLYAITAFAGKKASNVKLTTVKDFAERNGDDDATPHRRRSSRADSLGSAPRCATRRVSWRGRSAGHRLLLILSDGRPNDVDEYQGRTASRIRGRRSWKRARRASFRSV